MLREVPSLTVLPSSMIVQAPHQVSSDLAGEAVILGLTSGVYYGLDEVGARIWSLIQEPRRVSDIRDTLLEEYDVEPAECEQDLMALLQELATAELIEVRNEPRP